MNIRSLSILIVILLVIAGLISGLFADSIQRALTVTPVEQPEQNVPAPQATIPAQATPSVQATPPEQATLPAQGTPPVPLTPPVIATIPVRNSPTPTTALPTNILAQDNFMRANLETGWGTASNGREWLGDANISPAFSINNNTGLIVGAADTHANEQVTFDALLGAFAPDNAEVVVSGSVNRFTDDGAVNMGATLRWTDGNNWSKALIDGNNLVILKRVDGKTTELGKVPFKASANVVYSIRLRAVGATLFARVWQSDTPEQKGWMLLATDTTFVARDENVKVGIRVLVQKNTVIKIKSFFAASASSTV